MMNAETIKLIASIILAVLLSLGATLGMQHYRSLQAKAAQGEQRGNVLNAASGIIDAADKTDADRGITDNGVATTRDDYHVQLNQAKRNEPTVADREYRVVPDIVRALARQRRIARERLGRVDVGNQAQPAAANAAER